MGQRHRDLGEHRRPILANPERRAAVCQVGVKETGAQLWLLVAEGRRPVKCTEEVGLDDALRRPLAHHRRARCELQAEASITNVPIGEALVRPRLHVACPFRVLALAERAEYPAVVEEGRADEATDREGRTLTQLDHLLSGGGSRARHDQDDSDGRSSERCHSHSHDIPLS